MAGKEGDGAARLADVAQIIEQVLRREALALLALAASAEAGGVEKTAKAAKALCDAGRSLTALTAAVEKSAAIPHDGAGAEMDDEPDDADDLDRRRERLVERLVVGPFRARGDAAGGGCEHDHGGGAAMAAESAPVAAPA